MAKEKVFYDRYAKIRKERIEQRAKRNLIYDEDEMLKMMMDRPIPTMIQHCVLKVQKKVKGGPRAKFISAFNICVSVFAKYGYIKNKKGVGIEITGKGEKRNRIHQNETAASDKSSKYKADVFNLWSGEMKRLKEFEKETGKETKIKPKKVMPITADPKKTKSKKQKKQARKKPAEKAKTAKKAKAKKTKKAKKAKAKKVKRR